MEISEPYKHKMESCVIKWLNFRPSISTVKAIISCFNTFFVFLCQQLLHHCVCLLLQEEELRLVALQLVHSDYQLLEQPN